MIISVLVRANSHYFLAPLYIFSSQRPKVVVIHLSVSIISCKRIFTFISLIMSTELSARKFKKKHEIHKNLRRILLQLPCILYLNFPSSLSYVSHVSLLYSSFIALHLFLSHLSLASLAYTYLFLLFLTMPIYKQCNQHCTNI